MNRRLRTALLLATLAVALVASLRFPSPALGQQPAPMERGGLLDIRNDQEKSVFSHLRCTCGCPRESLSTCTCGFANGFRDEARGMMAQGMGIEEVKAAWAKRHGGPDALMVPSNTGANQFVYLVPLGVILGMAAVVITALRRFRARSDATDLKTKNDAVPAKAGPDDYDDKLDEELKRLDKE